MAEINPQTSSDFEEVETPETEEATEETEALGRDDEVGLVDEEEPTVLG